jgi:hypothetical protein
MNDSLTFPCPKLKGADDVVTKILPWFVFWHALFWGCVIAAPLLFSSYAKLDGPTKSYWASSMVSTIHAFYIVYVAWIAANELDVWNSIDFFTSNSSSSHANVVFVGYLCSDLLVTLYYNTRWPGWEANLLHHVAGIWCWYCFEKYSYGLVFAIPSMLIEGTTPFINQRFFFDKVEPLVVCFHCCT